VSDPEHADHKTLARYQEELQHLVMDLGRDDIGVGDVDAVGDTVHFTLTSGSHSHPAEISVRALADKEHAKDALTAILLPMSKAIEKEHLKAAHGGMRE
jgi:hypothetical protein